MKTDTIAAIPADGIGVEVLDDLTEKTGTFPFKFDPFDWGRTTTRSTA